MSISERLRPIAIALSLLLAPLTSDAQETDAQALADTLRVRIERAVVAADVGTIAQVRALADRAVTRAPDDAWLLHYRGYALYREATITMGRAPKTDISTILETAQKALENALAKRDIPETRALLASVLGQRIGSSPFRGMTLGPRSDREMETALKNAPENPRVWLLNGIGAFHKPKMFGGGVKPAEESLRRALALYERDNVKAPAPSWGHDEAWLWLGRVLEEQEKYADARAAYVRALELQPDNSWVRDVLLPGIEKKVKGTK
ncbi:MAG TPA: tetratricopeptide repeat protein [Longimicrobiales bacterium]|nr:tetratricopeptide repeat protein [Longimicrobiales bacterium]